MEVDLQTVTDHMYTTTSNCAEGRNVSSVDYLQRLPVSECAHAIVACGDRRSLQ